MRVTIFGGTGLLGKALVREWQGDKVVGLGSADADIRSDEQVGKVLRERRPECVVLAAAYTDVDGCETHSDLAFDVNCRGAVNVASECARTGSRLLFISTDYVFDGNKNTPYETDEPLSPQTVYGRTKAAAETEIRELHPEACILRTSWVFGMGGKCFPDTILKLAETRAELDVVDDQRGSPTYTVDLARTIRDLCRKNASGIVHATNCGACTWYDFASAAAKGAELPVRVRPTTSEKFVRPAKRPKYSVLSLASLERYGLQMPTWQDALGRYLTERRVPD
ncbi:MAG TPA: dTDP-4-dehydrorhamnose reductase [Terriglobales bacterium]|nr:dTDP-4-dehydrorhamnose reductase [Terriglobales bacterium]